MNQKNIDKELVHKHYKMGRGKYRLVSIWSAPSRSMQEANPVSYNNIMETRPACCHMSCNHCGTAITHHFIIEDEDKNRFCVGSSCIDKLGQHELVTAAQKMKKERQRQLRQEREEKRSEERRLKREEKLETQRKKNGGLTDLELLSKERQQRELDNKSKYRELSDPIVALLKMDGGSFCRDMAVKLRNGVAPSGGAKNITIEIMAKQHSGARKGSKAYNAALPKMKELFESVESTFKDFK